MNWITVTALQIKKLSSTRGVGETNERSDAMNMNTMRYRKPNLLVLLTVFVGLGVLTTSLVQAAQPAETTRTVEQSESDQWLQSLSSFDLLEKMQNWKLQLSANEDGDGVQLARPFGARGPALRISKSFPDEVERCLRAGGHPQFVGAAGTDSPDAYIFLQKRW